MHHKTRSLDSSVFDKCRVLLTWNLCSLVQFREQLDIMITDDTDKLHSVVHLEMDDQLLI